MSLTRLLRPYASFATRSAPKRTFTSTTRTREQLAFVISGHGHGVAQTVSVSDSTHQISTDAYPAFGGADRHPSPLHFSLTALSSCTQVTGSIVAKDHGFQLGKWEVGVTGQLDPAVLVAGERDNGNQGNWNAIDLQVKVQVDGANEDQFRNWASEVERRCPVTQLFKKSGVEWTSSWTNVRE